MSGRYGMIVVGAGPAGCAAAAEAAREGLGPVLLLEAGRLPQTKPCAGGITPMARRALKRMGLWERVLAAGYPVRSARVRTPSGREILFSGGRGALVVPRRRLSALLAAECRRLGVETREGCAVRGFLREGERVAGVRTADGQALRAAGLVVATGAAAGLLRPLVPASARGELLVACMGWLRPRGVPPHRLEVYFDPGIWPGYGWLFPESDTLVNVGVFLSRCAAGGRAPAAVLGELVKKFLPDMAAALPAGGPPGPRGGRLRTGVMRTCRRIGHPHVAGVLLAGEAAGLVNPFSGEGISYALRSGRLAARAWRRGLAEGWDHGRLRRRYLAGLRRELAPTLSTGAFFCRRCRGALHLAARLAEGSAPVRSVLFRLLA